MTTQPTDYDPDFADETDDHQQTPDEVARKRRAMHDMRQKAKAADEAQAKLAEAEAKLAQYERREALEKAKGELNAQGPLGAFLRTYDGEPTADAIRKAVAEDPDFRDLVVIPEDPRDAAAREQADNARRLAGADSPTLGEITPTDAAKWDRESRMAFMKQHPALYDKLLAGQTVTRPTT